MILSDEIDQEPEWDARPLIGADESVGVLHRQILVGSLPILPSIAGALDEVDPRDRRHGREIVDRQDQRLLHHAVNQKAVLGGIKIGHA